MHISAVGNGRTELVEGQAVLFDVEPNPRDGRLRATNVMGRLRPMTAPYRRGDG